MTEAQASTAGIPLAACLCDGNRNDVTQLEPFVEAIPAVQCRRDRPRRHPNRLSDDRVLRRRQVPKRPALQRDPAPDRSPRRASQLKPDAPNGARVAPRKLALNADKLALKDKPPPYGTCFDQHGSAAAQRYPDRDAAQRQPRRRRRDARDDHPGRVRYERNEGLPPVSEGNTTTVGWLKHGHEYEFYVTAIGEAGESDPSNLARATATFPPLPPPTNLVAAAGDRRVTLTWRSAGDDYWYWVHMRNVSAGETDFTKLDLPVTTCCTFVSDGLTNGDTYEFKVTAIGSDGATDSTPTNVARATPVGLPADSPTDLEATPGDGRVYLTWTASLTPDAWY